jgi:hypothetical protein
MNQPEVKQICITRIARIESRSPKERNEKEIMDCIEDAYYSLRSKAKVMSLALVGASQTISTESFSDGEVSYVLYIISLVGSGADISQIEAQQRIQNLDPRSVLKGRTN